jgi:hypothetical protein
MISYLFGDATEFDSTDKSIQHFVIHCCNDQKVWGSGFVLAISHRWKQPEQFYKNAKNLKLGTNQWVKVEKNIHVVNMIAQTFGRKDGPPIKYDALEQCLIDIQRTCAMTGKLCVIHAPKFGTVRAGGNWDIIESLITKHFSLSHPTIIFNVYDLKGSEEITKKVPDCI